MLIKIIIKITASCGPHLVHKGELPDTCLSQVHCEGEALPHHENACQFLAKKEPYVTLLIESVECVDKHVEAEKNMKKGE
jgi:hypothetical protein